MRRISFMAMLVIAAMAAASCCSQRSTVSSGNVEECAVLGFQYGSNLTAQEAKDIADVFRVNFHPSKYKVTEEERVDKILESRSYKNKKLTRQQMCDVGRSLGAKFVVFGSVSKLMGEYSVDVQVFDVLKETTVAFDGNAFPEQDYGNEIRNIARNLASKLE